VACLDTVKRYLWGLGRRLDDFRHDPYTNGCNKLRLTVKVNR